LNSTVNNSSKHILKRLSSYISRLIKTRKKIYYSWRDVSSLFILNTVFFLSLSLATLFFCIYFITYLCNMYYSCIYSLHLLLSLPNNVWRLIVFAPFYYYYSFFLSFRGPWTCPRQISGTTGQNFMKLGGVIDICFQLVLKFSALW
jgi:hypothetical protein